jgi:AraC-like DNA-binding protein
MSPSEILRPLSEWETVRLRLVWLYEADFPQGHRSGANPSVPFRLWRILAGRATVTYPTGTIAGEAGDWLVLPVAAQAQRLWPNTRLFSLALVDLSSSLAAALQTLKPCRLQSETPELAPMLAQLQAWAATQGTQMGSGRQMVFQPMAISTYRQGQDLLWGLLDLLHRFAGPGPAMQRLRTTEPDPRLARVLSMLAVHACTPFPDKAALATMAGLSWRRVEQLCRTHCDASPQVLHDRLRLAEAGRQLDVPHRSVKTIAYALGFPSSTQFSHWFKRQTGLSPAAWRQREGV